LVKLKRLGNSRGVCLSDNAQVTKFTAHNQVNLRFSKYHGTGNDFIMVDNRDWTIRLSQEQIVHLCDRRFGVGSDGLILIEPHDREVFFMNFYNPDGSQSFCGNGSRCAFAFAQKLGFPAELNFEAIDGVHDAHLTNGLVSVSMRDTNLPVIKGDELFVDTGSPHVVRLVSELDEKDLIGIARLIRYSPTFAPGGTNVNLIEIRDGSIHMRTYERGVENETLSCGTGVTAAALVAAHENLVESGVVVHTRGGKLSVLFSQDETGFKTIRLLGPATFVYEGEISL
jgi:diaminopimelate epimerase